jgi:hypothetical protein
VPLWDKLVGSQLNDRAIIVYPQSSGSPKDKQFW